MRILINLNNKTFKAILHYSKENNKSIEQSTEEAINDFLDPGYEQDLDELINKSQELAQTYKNINASLLQRELGVGYARALRLLNVIKNKN
jgi:DNA segregation ATPase FtsK/SpoIIIE-like protein